MSQAYHIQLDVAGCRRDRRRSIVTAIEAEWPVETWEDEGGRLHADGDSVVSGGEGEEAVAARLAVAVWRANEGFCEVSVHATYLDHLPPCNSYEFGEREYARLTGAAAG